MTAIPQRASGREKNGTINSTNVRTAKIKMTLEAVRVGLRVAEALPGDLAGAWSERLFTWPRRFERPERERTLLATAQELRIAMPHARPASASASTSARSSSPALRGWRWGDAALPAVLLAHGWQGRGAQLGALVAPLLARGFQVVTFDGPGHGDSPGSSLALPELARAIVAAARAAGPQPLHAVVAHSMGAAATSIALGHFGLVASRLVYLAPPAQLSRATGHFARTVGLSSDSRARLERRLERRTGLRMSEMDGATLARGMQTPLLVIHDTDDADVPISEGRLIADAWPGARLHATSGLGHQRVLWAPEVVAAATDFVTQAG